MENVLSNYEKHQHEVSEKIARVLDSTGVQPIIFAGSGLSQRYFGAPTWLGLLDQLCKDCPLVEYPLGYLTQKYNNDLPAVGSNLVEYYSRWAWGEGRKYFPDELFVPGQASDTYIKYHIARLLREAAPKNIEALHNHKYFDEINTFLSIRPHALITTNYDLFLDNIFEDYEAHVGYDIIYYNNITFGDIHKIHGSCDQHNSLVFTENDYKVFQDKSGYLSAKLITYFAEHLLIFVGYSAADRNIRTILQNIDNIVGKPGSLKDNIFFVEWRPQVNLMDIPPNEKLIALGNGHSIRVNNIVAGEFGWVYAALAQRSQAMNINPRTLRSLMTRMYELVRRDIPRQQLDVDYQTIERAANVDGELAKLFGVTILDDGANANITHPYILSQVAAELGYRSWYHANQLIEKIKLDKGVDIKASDNRYHIAIKTGRKTINRKYSDDLVETCKKVRDNIDYEIKLHD